MKRLIILTIFAMTVIIGCGGGSSSSGSSPDTNTEGSTGKTTSGVAVDPYIVGAVFCIDENLNKTCDAGEPESTASDENGVFTFSEALEEGDKIVMKTAGTHLGVPYQFDKMTAEFKGGELVVSPLTTLAEKELTNEQVVALLDPDGLLGLHPAAVNTEPIPVIKGDTDITDEDLAAIRANIGAYMLLRMIENNPDLAALTGEELVDSTEVQQIAEEMMSTITEAITVDKISTFQDMIPNGANVPDIDIMDVINTAVTVCDHIMEVAENEYNSSGNLGQAMAAVQSFKNNDLDTFIDNTAPAQYIKRVIKNNMVSSTLMQQAFSEYSEFVSCNKGLKMNTNGRPMCYTEDDSDTDTGGTVNPDTGDLSDVQAMIADSPVIKYDFGSDAIEASADNFNIYSRAAGDLSTGACYTNAVRNNASFYIPDVEFFRCALAKAADADMLTGIEDGVYYVKFLTDGLEQKTKLTYSGSNVTMSMCYNADAESNQQTENVHVSITKSTNGYDVEGVVVRDNDYNGAADGGEVSEGLKLYASAATTGNREIYSYIIHTLNEQSSNCTGASGASLTEDDNQCFLRYEGNIVNGRQQMIDYSIYNGLFAEKGYNTDEGLYFAGTSFATAMANGYGYTVYSVPVEAGFSFISAVEEGWLAYSMIEDNNATELANYFGDNLSAPARTTVIPTISDPWNCESTGDFASVDLDSIPNVNECTQKRLGGSGDVTTCSEGIDSVNFKEQMQQYICDETDPITNNAAACQ